MQLGLAPSGLGAAGRSTDSDAPDGLSDLATGQVVPTTVQPPQPAAKPELPFNRQIREASEAAAKQAAADKQAALKLSASMNEGNLTDAQKSAKIVEERTAAEKEIADQEEAQAQAGRDAQAAAELAAVEVNDKMGLTTVDLSQPREELIEADAYVPTPDEINKQLLIDTRAKLAELEAAEAASKAAPADTQVDESLSESPETD